jgi:hypothetical protein
MLGVELDDVVDYLKENFGKLLILLGIAAFISGLLLLETFGSVWSAIGFFFGIVLVASGFFFELELFSDIRSLAGLGSILIFASIIFFALSVSFFQFLEISSVSYIQEIFKGAVLPFSRAILHTSRPYVWLCSLFFWAGFSLLIFGLVVKIINFTGLA